MNTAVRGQVYRVDLGHGAKPWVVISNNDHNRTLDTVMAARITTSHKHQAEPSVVPLDKQDPLAGFVLVDDLHQLYHDELTTSPGALCVSTMKAISTALRIALP